MRQKLFISFEQNITFGKKNQILVSFPWWIISAYITFLWILCNRIVFVYRKKCHNRSGEWAWRYLPIHLGHCQWTSRIRETIELQGHHEQQQSMGKNMYKRWTRFLHKTGQCPSPKILVHRMRRFPSASKRNYGFEARWGFRSQEHRKYCPTFRYQCVSSNSIRCWTSQSVGHTYRWTLRLWGDQGGLPTEWFWALGVLVKSCPRTQVQVSWVLDRGTEPERENVGWTQCSTTSYQCF